MYNENNKFLSTLKALKFTKNNLNKFATRTVCHQSIFVHKSKIFKYNLRYRLKAELNWYYDILKNIKKDQKKYVNLSIVNYILGGEGDKHFFENNLEKIKVTFSQNNMLGFVLSIPFFIIPFIFRIRRMLLGK